MTADLNGAASSRVPRIGVTNWDDIPAEALSRYHARITEAGATVVDLRDAQSAAAVPALDALMLTGGIDVDPDVYGAAERHPKVKEVDPGRDEMELACLSAALDRDLPVLAICRGHQVLNVGFGGQLVQHIDSGDHRADFRTPGYPSRWHDLRLDPESRLATILGPGPLHINSRHHQAVTASTLGDGLRPVAWADDHGGELIEGMESTRHSWVVAVQWHPERLEEQQPAFAPVMRRLFDAFIAQARVARV
jgi:putative glutamine amidotransferase